LNQKEIDIVELLLKHKDEAIHWTSTALSYGGSAEFRTILLTSLVHFVAHKLKHVSIEDALCVIDKNFFTRYTDLAFYLDKELYQNEHKNTVH
jgi:hypothetical protein